MIGKRTSTLQLARTANHAWCVWVWLAQMGTQARPLYCVSGICVPMGAEHELCVYVCMCARMGAFHEYVFALGHTHMRTHIHSHIHARARTHTRTRMHMQRTPTRSVRCTRRLLTQQSRELLLLWPTQPQPPC